MKRIITIFSVLVLSLALCIGINADGAAIAIEGEPSVSAGENISFTVTLSGCTEATSASVVITLGEGLALVSGEWLKGGTPAFDIASGTCTLSMTEAADLNGALFGFTVRADAASLDARNVGVSLTAKNGEDEILSVTAQTSVTVLCIEHTLGDPTKADDENHVRACSVCPYKETAPHEWNEGTVTKEASCKETGTKEFSCSVCLGTKTETIEKTEDHEYGDWSETKTPDCTNKGEETRVCSKCEKEDKRETDEKGHKVEQFTVTDEPSCTEEGTREGECTVCHQIVTEKIEKTEHDYGEPVVKEEATVDKEGLQIYTCKDCQTEKEERIPKLPAPETTTPPVITPPVTTTPETTEKQPETTQPEVTFPEITFPMPEFTEEPESTERAPDDTQPIPDEENDPTPAIAVVIAIVSVGCVALAIVLFMRKNKLI